MRENIQPEEVAGSPELVFESAGDLFAPVLPVYAARSEPIGGLKVRDPVMPGWRLAGGLVNSLTNSLTKG